jgi:hypothetical protein
MFGTFRTSCWSDRGEGIVVTGLYIETSLTARPPDRNGIGQGSILIVASTDAGTD